MRKEENKQNKLLLTYFDNTMSEAQKHRIFTTSFASVYPLYVQKVEKKGRTKQELDAVIYWLTGYDEAGLTEQINLKKDFETFFAEAPAFNPDAGKIKGLICGYRVEDIEDPLMQKIRYLDKLIDDLAKGRDARFGRLYGIEIRI